MQQRLAKTEPVGHAQVHSVATGRHRLPRSVACEATAVSGSPVDSGTIPDDGHDFDKELTPAAPEVLDDINESQDENPPSKPAPPVGSRWARVVAYGLLPGLAVVLGGGAGVLTWEVVSAHLLQSARVDSVRAAQDGAAAILTYRPDTVDADLGAARERLTGKFKDSYTLFTNQTVIPDARRNHTSSMVYVPAAASVSATLDHAVVMVYVNQTFMHDPDPPTSTTSTVRVTLDKVGRRWLISEFAPI